jgi:formylglycine-generating enzyme required for sulfatase activity
MDEIFISYKSEDRARILPLVEALERQGWPVWWDRKIPPGRRFAEVIDEKLNAAPCIVVVWTKDSVGADWVIEEAEEGKKRAVLVPALLDEVSPPRGFRRIETARLTDWQGEPDHPELELLLESVAALVGEAPKPKPAEPEGVPPRLDGVPAIFNTWLVAAEDKTPPAAGPATEGRGLAGLKATPVTYVPPNLPSGVGHLSNWQYVGMLATLIIVGVLLNKFCGGEARRTSSAASPVPALETQSPAVGNAAKAGPFGMEFVTIPAGEFRMGSENGDDNEKPVHQVRLSRSFEMGKYEVTQAEWQAVMNNNPSHFKGEKLPVETVSWAAAQGFIERLNARDDGYVYRLPTEAEWEYACRAGSTGDYAGQLDEMGWYDGNAGGKTHPVGQKKPNAWGLYDLHGNVWEWCQDWLDKYPSAAVTDPIGLNTGSGRVFRGGSWNYTAADCRSANRLGFSPGDGFYYLGFRLVRTAK